MDPNQNPVVPPAQTSPTIPVAQNLEPQKSNRTTYFIVLVLVALLAAGGYFFLIKNSISQATPTSPPPTTQAEIKTTDLAPGIPSSQKTIVLVQHSDSSREKFVVQTSLLDGYIKTLPEGDKVISQNPAQ